MIHVLVGWSECIAWWGSMVYCVVVVMRTSVAF